MFASLTPRERAGLAVGAGVLSILALAGWARVSATPAPLLSEARAADRDPEPDLRVAPVVVPEAPPRPTPLVVYVSGAVRTPGVYTLPSGARVVKAIHVAGGFRGSARRDALNLAARLEDADQVHVPERGEAPVAEALPDDDPKAGRVLGKPAPAPKAAAKGKGAPAKFKKPGDGTVSLNRATAAELQRLPGVGPAMAERILAARKERGKFAAIEQLADVKGIGEKKLEKLKPFLTLD